jgi:hypothetical protein
MNRFTIPIFALALASCSRPPSPASDPTLAIAAGDYCERFPERCQPCADCEGTASVWACCDGNGGCVAVALASECGAGMNLYSFPCEAGESTTTSDGTPIIICHD